MNIFGVEIKWSGKNGKCVKKVDCDRLHGQVHYRITELDRHLNERFDDMSDRFTDIKDFIRTLWQR